MMKKVLILLLFSISICSYAQTQIDPTLAVTTARTNTAIKGSITASGTDTYTASVSNFTWASGEAMDITFPNGNTGSSTFQLNGGTTYTLKKKSSGSLVNLASGDIINGDRIRFYHNGTYLVIEGGTSSSSGSSSLVVGTTTVTSGTNTKVLYDNSGVLGEYTVSGSGNVAMTTSPAFTTPNIGSATGSISGNAATVTTNANLTGPVTSVGNATTVTAASITNAMLAGSIDLTTKVTGLLPDANVASASIWNAKISSQWTTTGSDIYYNTGNVMIGSTSSPSSKLHVVETITSTPRGVLVDQYNTGTNGARITMRKARGSFASPTTIVTGDVLASWTASGYDGAGFIESGKLLTTSEGTIATNIVPSKMDLQTANSAGTLTTGFSLNSAQLVTIPAYTTSNGILYTNGSGVVSQATVGSLPGLGSGVGTWLTTPSWTNFNSAITGTAPYWSLASGGTLTGSNTITSNTANFLNHAGTFTATANSQYFANYGGTFTTRAIASDVFTGVQYAQSFIAGSTGQSIAAVRINPTWSTTNSPTNVGLWITVGTGDTGAIPLYIETTAGARLFQFSGAGILSVGSNGTASVGSQNSGSASATGRGPNFSTTLNGSNSVGFQFSQNSANISDGTLASKRFIRAGNFTFNPSSGAQGIDIVDVSPTINTTSTFTGDIRAFVYDPTQTAWTGTNNYAWYNSSGFIAWNSVLSPAQITSNQNNYNPTGWINGGAPNGAAILRINSDAARSITSLAGGVSGRLIEITNTGSFAITFTADDGSTGTAANRFVVTTVLNPGETVFGFYDGTSSRWRLNGRMNANGQIVGTATNDNATAGNVGEEFNSGLSTYTNYTATATYQNVASITLTAGDWEISATGTYYTNASTITAGSDAIFVISTTTASASGSTEGKNVSYIPQAALLATSHETVNISPYRVSLSGSTTYYLNTQATFTIGNPQFVGSIHATRKR